MDILLDNLSHDVSVQNLDLAVASGSEGLAQHLKIRLQFFLGEWFLDTTAGIPYFQNIFVKAPVRSEIESIFKQAILTTPAVKELLSFSLGYDEKLRELDVDFRVDTDFGILDFPLQLSVDANPPITLPDEVDLVEDFNFNNPAYWNNPFPSTWSIGGGQAVSNGFDFNSNFNTPTLNLTPGNVHRLLIELGSVAQGRLGFTMFPHITEEFVAPLSNTTFEKTFVPDSSSGTIFISGQQSCQCVIRQLRVLDTGLLPPVNLIEDGGFDNAIAWQLGDGWQVSTMTISSAGHDPSALDSELKSAVFDLELGKNYQLELEITALEGGALSVLILDEMENDTIYNAGTLISPGPIQPAVKQVFKAIGSRGKIVFRAQANTQCLLENVYLTEVQD